MSASRPDVRGWAGSPCFKFAPELNLQITAQGTPLRMKAAEFFLHLARNKPESNMRLLFQLHAWGLSVTLHPNFSRRTAG